MDELSSHNENRGKYYRSFVDYGTLNSDLEGEDCDQVYDGINCNVGTEHFVRILRRHIEKNTTNIVKESMDHESNFDIDK